ncbi:hypothetical protein UFOVP117_119 [uncultured Caudovirales phage]|uniref:Uncharacterized protein n=1 Tax=uncultured Caudovirales phage TaxID=2100421 RepID=A0A6J5L4X8_9CAUD|nr:hypothetical protein UFOVP117_119 [uncultured Caudovirales phage]
MNKRIFETTIRESKDYFNTREHIWDLDNQLDLKYILSLPAFSRFKKAADIVWADNVPGFKIRLTPDFKDKSYIVYLIVDKKSGKLLKGGKSKNPLNLRSYSAGTEETWTERGTCSETNYVWSQIFRRSIKDNNPIEIYAMVVPSIEYSFDSFDGNIVTKTISPYEEEEKKMNAFLKKLKGGNLIGEGDLLAKFKK